MCNEPGEEGVCVHICACVHACGLEMSVMNQVRRERVCMCACVWTGDECVMNQVRRECRGRSRK